MKPSQLDYRIGTHREFLQRMIGNLKSQRISDGPNAGSTPLSRLTTRNADDPSLALLDAWATVSDVLTFYQERIANEGFLRTATEKLSVLELARAVGYELGSGLAAGCYLAFSVDDTPGAAKEAVVPARTKVNSLPEQGKAMQTFETSYEFVAKAGWNHLKPRPLKPQMLTHITQVLYLQGLATGVSAGDVLLFVIEKGEQVTTRIINVLEVEINAKMDQTKVTLEEAVQAGEVTASQVKIMKFSARTGVFGHDASLWENLPLPENLRGGADTDNYPTGWDGENTRDIWSDSQGTLLRESDLLLDNVISGIVDGSWIVLRTTVDGQSRRSALRVRNAGEISRVDFGLTRKVSSLQLEQASGQVLSDSDKQGELSSYKTRKTTCYVESKILVLNQVALEAPLEQGVDQMLELDRIHDDLQPGLPLMIQGETLVTGVESSENISELAFLERTQLSDDGAVTVVYFKTPIKNSYIRASVVLNANLVRATHGETVSQVLGSGDTRKKNQAFILMDTPLTHVAAETEGGQKSELLIWVNEVRWKEIPSLYEAEPGAQVYMIRENGAAMTKVIFGDGEKGARLPTGQENIKAIYRKGIGHSGEVSRGALTLLQTRPPGIRSVTNPEAADGAAAPETANEARENAALSTVILDRLVSLKDYEDYARSFNGIAKAQAVPLWSGENRMVHVTVAGNGGDVVTGELRDSLFYAARAIGADSVSVGIDSYRQFQFTVEAKLLIDENAIEEQVLEKAEQLLLDSYAFENRNFSEGISASEIIALLQNISGVIAVDVDALYQYESGKENEAVRTLNSKLSVPQSRWDEDGILAAGLLLLTKTGIQLKRWV